MEDIKQYLKDNLRIEILAENNSSYDDNNNIRVSITLMLDGEVLSSDYDSFSVESD